MTEAVKKIENNPVVAPQKEAEKKVKVRVPHVGRTEEEIKGEEPVAVQINGKWTILPRGKDVEVSEAVREVLISRNII